VFRSTVGAAVLATAIAAAAVSGLPVGAASGAGTSSGPATRLTGPGKRVTVAVFGDSVTEGYTVPNFLRDGFIPQLARAVQGFGFSPGGVGLVPTSPARWRLSAWTAPGLGPLPPNGWWLVGTSVLSGADGPSGYSAIAASPSAYAWVTVADRDVSIIYTTTSAHTSFTVTAAGRSWTISTYRPGTQIDAEANLVLPPGRHRLTIHGPATGLLAFDGAIVHRPVPLGQTQVEVDNLGHAGKLPETDLKPRVIQSVLGQHYNVSVLMYGFLAEQVISRGSLARAYATALLTRARLARLGGGSCLIVAPTPLPVPKSAVNIVAGIDRTVARQSGCQYTTALTHLWASPLDAENRGLVLVDDVHPSAAGYRLMVGALAPIVVNMVRAQLRQHH
jgi:hypothetical protein